jgi:type 1 fimbria pilin
MQWRLVGLVVLLFALQAQAGDDDLNPFTGHATMSGEVLASGCSIALADRYQVVSLDAQSLREMGTQAVVKPFHIRLDNCVPAGVVDKRYSSDPAIKIRFDGIQGTLPGQFSPTGTARGIALILRDERHELLYPGEFSRALFDRSHEQQTLNFTLELVPDGTPLQAGDYYAALRFGVDYE